MADINRLLQSLKVTDAAAAVGTGSNSKSANTRFRNDQKRAAAQSMGSNIAARSLFKPQQSSTRPPVGPSQMPMPVNSPAPMGQSAPQQGNLLPNPVNSDPMGELKQKVDLEMVMRTPEFQDAVTKNQIKTYFQRRNNPNYIEPTPGERVQDMFNLLD